MTHDQKDSRSVPAGFGMTSSPGNLSRYRDEEYFKQQNLELSQRLVLDVSRC
jgi:hypothetical protein